jgi:hypothetical protein
VGAGAGAVIRVYGSATLILSFFGMCSDRGTSLLCRNQSGDHGYATAQTETAALANPSPGDTEPTLAASVSLVVESSADDREAAVVGADSALPMSLVCWLVFLIIGIFLYTEFLHVFLTCRNCL